MDSTVSLQEFEARITARVFVAVHNPERGPAVSQLLEHLLAVLDGPSPDARMGCSEAPGSFPALGSGP